MLELITAPADRKNPGLSVLLDEQELAKQLELFSHEHWKPLCPQEFRARVLRWHSGNRCALEIALKNGDRAHDLIGKIYHVERPDIYHYLGELQRAGFDRGSKYATPEPLAYVPSLRLLLEEKVQGPAVREIFLSADRLRQVEAAKRSALWLAYFHDLAPKGGPVVTLEVQSCELARWARRLAALGSPLAEKSNELARRAGMKIPKLGTVEGVAGHGSYTPDHVLLANDQTVVIDWDSYDVADPARDVARFLVATERLALGQLDSIRALDQLADAFVETYVARRGAGVLSRLPFYRAAMCLKLAKYCAFSQNLRMGEKKAAAMLDEGMRVLEG